MLTRKDDDTFCIKRRNVCKAIFRDTLSLDDSNAFFRKLELVLRIKELCGKSKFKERKITFVISSTPRVPSDRSILYIVMHAIPLERR